MLSLPWGYHDEIVCRDYVTGLKFHVYYCDEDMNMISQADVLAVFLRHH